MAIIITIIIFDVGHMPGNSMSVCPTFYSSEPLP